MQNYILNLSFSLTVALSIVSKVFCHKKFLLQFNPAADFRSSIHYIKVISTDQSLRLWIHFQFQLENTASQTGLLQIACSR